MAKMTVYDMVRAKAKAMGHDAADLSNKVLEGLVESDRRQMTLLGAKLYLENYAAGNINAADFANVLAANDQLRYTVSDLCRMKLEPKELNIQRNNDYIDLGAGLKTFWSEMKVPLPYEQQAMRDLQNINLGIAAGRRQAGPAADTEAPAEGKPKRRSLRDVLSDARNKISDNINSKLAEGMGKVKDYPVDEAWMETEDGKAYKEAYTRKVAQQVENVVMDIEAGKDKELAPEERKKAMQAAGMTEEQARNTVEEQEAPQRRSQYHDKELEASTEEDMKKMFSQQVEVNSQAELRSGYSRDELSSSTGDQMEDLLKQINRHMGNTEKKEAERDKGQDKGQEKGQGRKQGRQRDDRFYGQFEGKDVSFKKRWSSHEFTEEEAKQLLAGESVTFEYQRGDLTKTATGKLEWQEYEGRPFLGFKPDFSKKQEAPAEDKGSSELFSAQDEAAMNGYTGGEEDMDDYFARVAQDMEGYQAEETSASYAEAEEGQTELSAADLAGLFEDSGQAMTL